MPQLCFARTVYRKYGTTRQQIGHTRTGRSQVLGVPASLSRDNVLRQEQLHFSSCCRLRPSIVRMSAVLGQDVGQEADVALSRDLIDEINILAQSKEWVESTQFLYERLSHHHRREQDVLVTSEEGAILCSFCVDGASGFSGLVYCAVP
jgi:hypothetical protein